MIRFVNIENIDCRYNLRQQFPVPSLCAERAFRGTLRAEPCWWFPSSQCPLTQKQFWIQPQTCWLIGGFWKGKEEVVFMSVHINLQIQNFTPIVSWKGVNFAYDNIFATHAIWTNHRHYRRMKPPHQPCNSNLKDDFITQFSITFWIKVFFKISPLCTKNCPRWLKREHGNYTAYLPF